VAFAAVEEVEEVPREVGAKRFLLTKINFKAPQKRDSVFNLSIKI